MTRTPASASELLYEGASAGDALEAYANEQRTGNEPQLWLNGRRIPRYLASDNRLW